jgi:hypothetical protein
MEKNGRKLGFFCPSDWWLSDRIPSPEAMGAGLFFDDLDRRLYGKG